MLGLRDHLLGIMASVKLGTWPVGQNISRLTGFYFKELFTQLALCPVWSSVLSPKRCTNTFLRY